MKKLTRIKRLRGVFILLFLLFAIEIINCQSTHWVGSWSCAPYAAGAKNTPPSPYLTNNTLRQVVRVSIGGDTIRLKFSNKTCSTPVTMKSVYLAKSDGASAIDVSTNTRLEFDGDTSVTIAAYSSVTSDALAFPLSPGMQVAITIYYGNVESSVDITSHVGSRTDSYIVSGNKSTQVDFSGATITPHWYHINTIDVLAPDTAACVGVLGNSITDGYGLSGGLQNRWTDIFSQKLLDDERTDQIGVLNLGIGATLVSGSGATTGLSRYKDDVLSQSGLRWIVIFYGTNDIGGEADASTIISAYQTIIEDAHEMGIKVYGSTITPFKGHSYYTEAHEQVRTSVNEWIRDSGKFDACIDFDKAIRDTDDTIKMAAVYSNDWLHPNAEGYAFLGNSVNADLFTDIENNEKLFANAGSDQSLIDLGNTGSVEVRLNGTLSRSWGSNIIKYTWTLEGSKIATGESPLVILPVGNHTILLTITDNDKNTDTDVVIIKITEDTGVWLEAECGEIGSLWDVAYDNNASDGEYISIKPGNNSTDAAPYNSTGQAIYTFDVKESGAYYLYARLICPSPNDDSFWIKMNNGSFSMWNNISAATWQWIQFNSGFSLNTGMNTLTVGYREDGARLDKIWITKASGNITNDGSPSTNCQTSSKAIKTSGDINIYPNPVSKEVSLK